MVDDNIELTDEFKEALDLMENTNESAFITGPAGTGKSTLLKHHKEITKKNVVFLAPTGIAALNIGGQTIHSFFMFPPKILVDGDVEKVHNSMYKEIETFVIDEISMVRADVFDAMDKFLRLNGRDPNKPFGGVQIILFGDLYQLRPVVKREEGEFFYNFYKSPYFFDAQVMKDFHFSLIDLTKVYRQNNPGFIEFLEKVRKGNVSDFDLRYINSRVCKPSDEFITSTPTNFVANKINIEKLEKINNLLFKYKAKIEGNFNLEYPTDLELNLKKDAQVIFIRNDNGGGGSGRWVNGTLGKVVECEKDHIKVKINNDSIHDVYPVDWDKRKYEYDRYTKKIIEKVVGTFTQLPLKLAWAITIHKSQSQTLDRLHINLSSGVWEPGQTYVSLGRCRTLEGITLERKINLSDIKVDPRVTEFLKNKLKQDNIENGK